MNVFLLSNRATTVGFNLVVGPLPSLCLCEISTSVARPSAGTVLLVHLVNQCTNAVQCHASILP